MANRVISTAKGRTLWVWTGLTNKDVGYQKQNLWFRQPKRWLQFRGLVRCCDWGYTQLKCVNCCSIMVDVCILSVPRCTFCRPRSSFFDVSDLSRVLKTLLRRLSQIALSYPKPCPAIMASSDATWCHTEPTPATANALRWQILPSSHVSVSELARLQYQLYGPSKWIDPTLNHGFYVAFRDLIIKYTEKVGWNLGKWHFQCDLCFFRWRLGCVHLDAQASRHPCCQKRSPGP